MKITIVEPAWGLFFLKSLNNFVNSNSLLMYIVPITADIFVFTYPIYLVSLYCYGIFKKNIYYKYSSLYVFFCSLFAVCVNLALQIVVYKQRPEDYIDKSKLLLKHIPDASFPSDHACVSAAIAMSTLLWGVRNNHKMFIYLGLVFWIFSIVMSISRVAVGVHWPSDVIVGTLIGMLISYLLLNKNVYKFFEFKVFDFLISIEKALFRKLFNIKQ